MNPKNLLPVFILFLASLFTSQTEAKDMKLVADSLWTQLSKATTSTDSLPILENLFDVLPQRQSMNIGLKIFEVAKRAGDSSAALEMLRNLANLYLLNDSMLVELYNRTECFDGSPAHNDNESILANQDELRETRTFIKIARNIYRANYAPEEERDEILNDLLKTYTINRPTDIYEQMVLLHGICSLLSCSGADAFLTRYLEKLDNVIQQLPPSAISLLNSYYIYAALLYNDTDQFEKSFQADRKTLEVINNLEKRYHDRGRIFRSYDANRYIIYQRILSNYDKLAPPELERYYQYAMKCVNNNIVAARTNATFPGPQIYYNMAHKKYRQALNDIKNCINDNYVTANSQRLKTLLKYEIECAKALNDNETLLEASLQYNDLLEAYLSSRIDERYKELQVIYDTYEIRNDYNKLQLEKQQSESESMRIIVIIGVIAILILLSSVGILFRLYRRNRALVNTLDKSNRALRNESSNLEKSRADLLKARDQAQKANNMKTDFIKNMSYEVKAPLKAINEYCKLIVDCADATNKKYLERFTSLVELNSELLSTIINDVLHISEIDSESVPIHNRPVELRPLCTMVLDGVRHRLSPNVSLMFDTSSPNISLFTDPQRIHQILLNILTNAAKFTTKGSITLAYTVDNEKETVTFSVTDTGIGIKADKKDVIFDRFVKLDKETQGAGLGLTISRMMARILGGDVVLDTTYTKGARFLLILPKK